MADGWKWKVRGSRKLLEKEPRYRRSLYFYHGQDGEERTFKRYIYQRLDNEYVLHLFKLLVCLVNFVHQTAAVKLCSVTAMLE